MTLGLEVVAIVGSGAVAAGIARLAAGAGHRVVLCEDSPQALQGVKDPQLVIDAVEQSAADKPRLFAELEALCGPDTVLVTAVDATSVNRLASRLKLPQRLIGIHCRTDFESTRLVEVVSGCATAVDTARYVGQLLAAWGKHCAHCRCAPGLIVERLTAAFQSEAIRLIEERAATPAALDTIMRETGGFEPGPVEGMGRLGHDVGYSRGLDLFEGCFGDPRFKPGMLQRELADAAGSGRGFDAEPGGARTESGRSTPDTAADRRLRIGSGLGIASSLRALFGEADLAVEDGNRSGVIEYDGVALALTDGRSATERAWSERRADLVLYDLALDYTTSTRIAVAAADQSGAGVLDRAIGLFRSIGKTVSVIEDVPGMIVMRTVCTLSNAGADLVGRGVCEVRDVDRAMRHGAGYPMGPLVWADRIGLDHVLATLDNLHRSYGEDRYRVSPALRRRCRRRLDFYGGPMISAGEGA